MRECCDAGAAKVCSADTAGERGSNHKEHKGHKAEKLVRRSRTCACSFPANRPRQKNSHKKAHESQKENLTPGLRLLRFFAANLFPVRSFPPLCALCVLCGCSNHLQPTVLLRSASQILSPDPD
jgi:hypothetical protein